MEIIPSATRGSADHGWLKAKHTFSFAGYYNPERVQFGPLRVINEDRIAPGQGFGLHPHKDMEILTYPISGSIEHKDNLGNGTVIRAGDVQRMTAGRGVQHSEFNHSKTDELHLLQIWIFPEQKDLDPGYEQTAFSREQKLNQLRLIASRDGRDGSVTIHQRADIYASVLETGNSVLHAVEGDHKIFVQVVSGKLLLNEQTLSAGDGVQIEGENRLAIKAKMDAEFLLFDMG
ncbi:MAG TPA: pirin family protein [Woeseiaceae bacterium]|nr:pirin family protein [Woeseiaceae bacterium]